MHGDDSSLPNYNRPSLGNYILIPIRLKQETFWIDTLGSLKPTGLKTKRSEDILESAEKSDPVALVMPFSRTGNMTSRIINKHFKILPPKSYLEDYQYSTITA